MTTIARRGAVLIALRTTQPEVWRAEVRAALARHLEIDGAVAALEIGRRTIQRWLAEDPLLARGLAMRGRGRPRIRARS